MAGPSFNLRQQAYDRIRELLRSGDLSPGDRVSSLGLSKRLGISRTPVREALSRLCSDGVVREVPGFGVMVHIPDEKELVELYGLREVLECYAAREAARHITNEEVVRLVEPRVDPILAPQLFPLPLDALLRSKGGRRRRLLSR